MKSLYLTDEHRVILDEMLTKLFPEYPGIGLYEHNLNYVKFKEFNIFRYIPWFEFCAIYIMEKLQRNGGGKEFSDFMDVCFTYSFPQWNIHAQKIHPVDYLYNKFKELQ